MRPDRDLDVIDAKLARGEMAKVGRYQLLHRIGMGAFGRVYGGSDPQLDRTVAIKLLHSTLTKQQSKLQKEARVLASFNHPNVIAVHDAGVYRVDQLVPAGSGEGVFVVMEMINGQSLDSWLASSPRTLGEILGMYEQAGRGLHEAHRGGLVHRDVKPSNILVEVGGRAVVADFGVAAAFGLKSAPSDFDDLHVRETRTVGLTGTPAYMAPEQFKGEPVGPATDQYGLCVSLYESLFSRLPFGGETVGEIKRNVLAGDLIAPTDDGLVPRSVLDALMIGLSVEPADRFASMAELVAKLSVARSSAAATSRPSRPAAARNLDFDLVGSTLVVVQSATNPTNAEVERLLAAVHELSPAACLVITDGGLPAELDIPMAVVTDDARVQAHFTERTFAADAIAEALSAVQVPDSHMLSLFEAMERVRGRLDL